LQDILPLIEDLNNAGIRFVYFSAENELRSRAFAERMGLETGWNCHISLREGSGHLMEDHGSSATVSERNPESLFDTQDDIYVAGQDGDEKHVSWRGVQSDDSPEKVSHKMEGPEMDPLLESHSDGGTLLGSSQISAPEDYWFFSNRAKLPRGIQNIRPHLENVDNVPLLVPLFTDCSPSAVQEMISIMQDYGEVVCCVGSSFNSVNPAIFIQADISIAVEPLFPQLCLKGLPKDFRSGTPQLGHENARDKLHRQLSEQSTEEENELSPLELSAFLNALPCSLAFHRDASFEFKDLIKEARRLCSGLRNCFSFMLSCQLVLSAVMLLSSCLLLPPPLTGLHLLWLSCLTVPLLSLSLIGSPADPDLMTMITEKNDRNFKDITHTVCLLFSVCFFPSVCVCCLVLFPLNLHGICLSLNKKSSGCHYLLGFRNSTELWNSLGQSHIQALAMAQDINVFFLVLLFVFMSSSYVHRLHLLWRKSPFVNKSWICSVFVILLLQLIYFTLSQVEWSRRAPVVYSITDVPIPSIVVIILWPVVALAVCEFFKRRYIKERIRYQRRAKLKFGTKLGMNSPF